MRAILSDYDATIVPVAIMEKYRPIQKNSKLEQILGVFSTGFLSV
jgi:hypothetical protein